MNFLKAFSFDLLGFVDVGCVSTFTFMKKFASAVLLAPVLLTAVGIVFPLCKNVEGFVNRCVKMALSILFLIYPFVSQTVFQ